VPQAGIELIGADGPDADAEVALVAVEALAALGLQRVSLDFTLPPLVPALLDKAGFDGAARRTLSRALDRKDAAAVTAHGGALAPLLTDLLRAAGPAAPALDALRAATLPAAARALAERLEQVYDRLRQAAPHLRVTIDPVEFRGFRYHTGLAVTFFAPGRHEELGRGGRYFSTDGEPATGITLFADAVLRAAGPRAARPTVFIPAGTDRATAQSLRDAGFATLAGLVPGDDAAEARRLRCSHVLVEETAQPLD
jgi:ATP phosphoribosyltransferase regulatory subunit